MIKGAIFDMDGTLLNSMPFWQRAGEIYLSSLNVKANPELRETLFSMTLEQTAEYLKDTYKLPLSQKEITDGINKTIEDFYFNNAKPKDGALNFIAELKSRGIKAAVATITPKYCAEAALKRLGFSSFFDFIITDSDVGSGKENPEIYLQAAKRLGTSPDETLVFEDALYAAKTAKNARFVTVGVYDEASKNAQNKLKSICSYYINSFSDCKILF